MDAWVRDLEAVVDALELERFPLLGISQGAAQVQAPTLVLHSRDDAGIPFEEGRLLASLIPGARFVPLASRNHILLEDEPAWLRFRGEVERFLGAAQEQETSANAAPAGVFPELTPRELDVLELLAAGASNTAIAEELILTPKTVRNCVSRIYAKLDTESRAQAVVLAREAGLGRRPH
jgi:DNA-binding CsgD family transcriptional regulator